MITPAHLAVLADAQRRAQRPERKRLLAEVRGWLQAKQEQEAATAASKQPKRVRP